LDAEKFGEILDDKLIHVLAAKQLIRELEEGACREKLNESDTKKMIVTLGVTYNLASSHTSFVAVDASINTPTQESMKSVDVNAALGPPPATRSSSSGFGAGPQLYAGSSSNSQFAEQDATLDMLSVSVGSLRAMSVSIENEVASHALMLNNLDNTICLGNNILADLSNQRDTLSSNSYMFSAEYTQAKGRRNLLIILAIIFFPITLLVFLCRFIIMGVTWLRRKF